MIGNEKTTPQSQFSCKRWSLGVRAPLQLLRQSLTVLANDPEYHNFFKWASCGYYTTAVWWWLSISSRRNAEKHDFLYNCASFLVQSGSRHYILHISAQSRAEKIHYIKPSVRFIHLHCPLHPGQGHSAYPGSMYREAGIHPACESISGARSHL